jgi:hypothetical protein
MVAVMVPETRRKFVGDEDLRRRNRAPHEMDENRRRRGEKVSRGCATSH